MDEAERALQDLLLERITVDQSLTERVGELLLAAWEGDAELAAALAGERPGHTVERAAKQDRESPPEVYLGAVHVEGFRGVAEPKTLPLRPGPGLTLVTGRNGSGKSSFAEAVELVLTGSSSRWTGRTAVWREGWRNLHSVGGTRIAVDVILAGSSGPTTIARTWTATDELDGGQWTRQRLSGRLAPPRTRYPPRSPDRLLWTPSQRIRRGSAGSLRRGSNSRPSSRTRYSRRTRRWLRRSPSSGDAQSKNSRGGTRRGARLLASSQRGTTTLPASVPRRRLTELKQAEDWLKATAGELRDQRLVPFAVKSQDVWRQLRQQSNVELGPIRLEGTSTRRRAVMDVSVDGAEGGAAIGVMSQGELHALGLSLFLPRATAEDSPFRFLVIDDPVQSMDPAKVDGLARVLAGVAEQRQVVVFTHDDRLPEAVRRFALDATVWEVHRRERSVVELRRADDPVRRYLDDARALARTPELPEDLRGELVASCCRSAIEAACHARVRVNRLSRGETHARVEQALAAATSTHQVATLAVFDDDARHGDLLGRLRNVGAWAINAFQNCRRGAHVSGDGDLHGLIRDSDRLTDWIVKWTATDEAQRRLDFADRLLRESGLVEEGVWPRACTWLIRLAIEHAVDGYWFARRPEVRDANHRAKLLTLRLTDPELGQHVTALWYALSRVAHHHSYELAPTATELRSWHTAAAEVVRGLAGPHGRHSLG